MEGRHAEFYIQYIGLRQSELPQDWQYTLTDGPAGFMLATK